MSLQNTQEIIRSTPSTPPEDTVSQKAGQTAESVNTIMKQRQNEFKAKQEAAIKSFKALDRWSMEEKDYVYAYQDLLRDLGYNYFPSTLQVATKQWVYRINYGKSRGKIQIDIIFQSASKKKSYKSSASWPFKKAA